VRELFGREHRCFSCKIGDYVDLRVLDVRLGEIHMYLLVRNLLLQILEIFGCQFDSGCACVPVAHLILFFLLFCLRGVEVSFVEELFLSRAGRQSKGFLGNLLQWSEGLRGALEEASALDLHVAEVVGVRLVGGRFVCKMG